LNLNYWYDALGFGELCAHELSSRLEVEVARSEAEAVVLDGGFGGGCLRDKRGWEDDDAVGYGRRVKRRVMSPGSSSLFSSLLGSC
jgi:hypothetical protein